MSDNRERLVRWAPTDGRSNPSSTRGRRTREAVLRAAVRVFGRDGVRQTSMFAIAEEAGVASGTVYQYFADKEDVFRCLLAGLEEDLQRDTVLDTDDEGELKGEAAVLRYLDLHRRHVAIYRAWWDLLEPQTEFTDAWLAFHARGRRQIKAAMASAAENGRLNEGLDPEITSEPGLFERVAYSRNILGWDEELTDENVAEVAGRLLGTGLLTAKD